jgi:hypothetical protein
VHCLGKIEYECESLVAGHGNPPAMAFIEVEDNGVDGLGLPTPSGLDGGGMHHGLLNIGRKKS